MPGEETTAALMAATARRALERLDEMAETVAEAIIAGDPTLADDPTLGRKVIASTRANTERFLRATAEDPTAPVPGDAPPEALDLARALVRRGIELDVLAHAYRRGQNVAWQMWLQIARELADPDQLPDLLAFSSDRIFRFIDEILMTMIRRVAAERSAVAEGLDQRRAETVRLLLEGAPIDEQTAARRLGYALDRHHTAFIAWTEGDAPAAGALERLAEELAQAAGARRALTVPESALALWGWIPSDGPIDLEPLRRAAAQAPPGVRVAVGSTRPGLAGFRTGHEEAAAVRRMLAGRPSPDRLVAHREVEVLALLADDRPRLQAFVADVLGPLAGAGGGRARLCDTLRVWLQEGESASRTAARLGTHRNTVLHRIARAEELLGHPVAERRLALAVALEARARLGIGAPEDASGDTARVA